MMPLDSRAPGTLEWKQNSAFSRTYELKGGDSVYAVLEFLKSFGSLAEARTTDGVWTLKRQGMLTPSACARVAGSEADVAIYKPHWTCTKGEITLAGGEKLHFHSASFWGHDWILAGADDQPLLRFITKGIIRHAAEMAIEPAGRKRPDLPLLAAFCWHILLLHQKDMALASAGASG